MNEISGDNTRKRQRRPVSSIGPVKKVTGWLEGVHFPRLSGITLLDILKSLFRQINNEAINVRAAAIAFNFIMAIPAFFIFIASLIPYFPSSKDIFNELIGIITQLTPNVKARDWAFSYLDKIFNRPSTGLLSVSVFVSFYYSSRAMLGVINSFDSSVLHRSKTNFIKKRGRAIKLTVVVVFLFIATMLILLGQGVFFQKIMHWLNIENQATRWIIKNSRWPVIILLFYIAIAYIYKYGPSVSSRGKLRTVGAWVATVLIILATVLFGYWVQNFSSYNNKLYGSIGSLMLMMLLIYIDSLMLLIGFELNNSLELLREEAENYQD